MVDDDGDFVAWGKSMMFGVKWYVESFGFRFSESAAGMSLTGGTGGGGYNLDCDESWFDCCYCSWMFHMMVKGSGLMVGQVI